MFGCDPFRIMIEGDMKKHLTKIRRIAEENEIFIIGDSKEGFFDTGVVRGTYGIDDDRIVITITDKPYKENCDTLKKLLTHLFTGDETMEYDNIFGYMYLTRL